MTFFDEGLKIEVDSDVSGAEQGIGNLIGTLKDADKAIAGLGLAAAGGAAAGIKTAVDAASNYEDQMVELEKVTSPETAEAMGKSIRGMASDMPVAQAELAGIAEQAGRLGVEGEENIESFTGSIARVATATNLTADEAATAFGKLRAPLNLSADEVENLGSSINAVSNTMGASSSEITDAAVRSSAALSQMGASETEVTALAGTMNEVSPNAEKAGGALRRMANAMMDPSNTEAFAEALGVTEEEFKRMREEDPSGTLLDVAEAASESKDSADVLKGELGKAGNEFVMLGQNTDSARDALETSNQAFKENTSLQKEADAASSTFSAQIQILKNSFRNVAIVVGQELLPYLTPLVSKFADLASKVTSMIQKSGRARMVAAALAGVLGVGLVVAIGATISVLGGFAAAAAVATTAVGALSTILGVLLGPIGLIIAAVAALAYAWKTNLFGIRDATRAVFDVIRGLINRFLSWAVPFYREHLAEIVTEFKKTATAWADAIRGFVEWVRPYIQAFLEAVTAWWDKWGDDIMAVVGPLFNGIKRLIEGWVSTMTDIIVSFLALIRADFDTASEKMTGIIDRFVGGIVDLFTWLKRKLVGGSIVPDMIQAIKGVFKAFADWIKFQWGIISSIVGVFTSVKDRGLSIIGDLVSGATDALRDFVNNVVPGWASDAASAFKSGFNSAVDDRLDIPSKTFNLPDYLGGGSKTVGGGSISIPQLDTGGFVDEAGLAQIHEGETVVPADVEPFRGRGGGDGARPIDITIERIEASGREEGREAGRALYKELKSHGVGF